MMTAPHVHVGRVLCSECVSCDGDVAGQNGSRAVPAALTRWICSVLLTLMPAFEVSEASFSEV